jgi:hypothetical protein
VEVLPCERRIGEAPVELRPAERQAGPLVLRGSVEAIEKSARLNPRAFFLSPSVRHAGKETRCELHRAEPIRRRFVCCQNRDLSGIPTEEHFMAAKKKSVLAQRIDELEEAVTRLFTGQGPAPQAKAKRRRKAKRKAAPAKAAKKVKKAAKKAKKAVKKVAGKAKRKIRR